jgi:hypothetical protein
VVSAQPDWLRRSNGVRLPDEARVVFTGCGTSFHAAQTGGRAVQSLMRCSAAGRRPHGLHLVRGPTLLMVEAARRSGRLWLVRPANNAPLAELAD